MEVVTFLVKSMSKLLFFFLIDNSLTFGNLPMAEHISLPHFTVARVSFLWVSCNSYCSLSSGNWFLGFQILFGGETVC